MWHMVGSLVSEAILESLFCSTGSNHYGFQDFCSPQLDAKSLRFVQPIIQEFVNLASFFLSFHTGSSFSVAFCSHSYHFSAWQRCITQDTQNWKSNSRDTVDGSEIRHPPVEVGSLSHYLQGFIHPRWLFGISSINSSNERNTHHQHQSKKDTKWNY